MPDKGHIETDKILNDLEKKLNETYKQAAKEMGDKLNEQTQKYQKKLDEMNEKLANGTISKDAYMKWKQSQSIQKLHLEQMCDTLAEDLTHTDEIAAAIINGHTPDVYALNYNFSTYEIEKGINASTSFVLYNHETVEHILRDNPDLLPQPKVNIAKDLKWNKQHINNAITQGILQGESIPKISKRMVETVGMSRNSAIRNARTATTGAQSMGRVDAYKRAENMGINVKQKWLATLDGRTRHTHRLIDGEIVDVGSKFSNNCRFPGDPQGPGSEVYNCRCTLVPVLKGFERPDDWKQRVIDYDEWKGGGTGYAHWLGEQAAPDSAIQSIWGNKKMSQMYNEIKAINTTDANKFYKELGKLGKPSEVWDQYLKGQLDAEDLKNFEEILKKYLPKETPLDDYSEWLKQWQGKGIFHMDVPFDVITYVQNKGVNNIMQYWEKYLAQEIKDPELDKILGYKKLDNAKTVNKIENIHKFAEESEKALNVSKGTLMTKDEADTYKVNPFYNKSDKTTLTNCQTTTFAYECRRQGYDVIALPKDKTFAEIFNKQDALGMNQSKGWINKTTGYSPGKLAGHAEAFNQSKNQIIDELENIIGKNGERYTMGVHWKSGGAHVVNIDRDEHGIIRIIDNQRGPGQKNTWTLEEYLNAKDVKNIRSLYRVDDCVPNAEYFNKIVVDASKVKTNVPAKITSADPNYSKLYKIAKDKNESPSAYYKKWKYGIVDDSELDDLFSKAFNLNKTDDIAAIKKSLSDTSIGKFVGPMDDDVYDEFMDIIKAEKEKTGHTSVIYWEKYINGEVKSSDLDDWISKYMSKSSTSSLKEAIPKASPKDKFKAKTTPSIPNSTPAPVAAPKAGTTVVDMDAVKNKKVTQVYNEIKADMSSKEANAFYNELKNIGKTDGLKQGDVWAKYLKGELDANDAAKIDKHLINKYNKQVEPLKPVVDIDALSKKKMSQVYNELKAENTSEANKFYNELKKHGKPSEVWDQYVKGELPDDVTSKVDSYLINKYNKGGTVTKTTTPVTNTINVTNNLANLAKDNKDLYDDVFKVLHDIKGSPSTNWKKYLTGEIDNPDLDKIMVKHNIASKEITEKIKKQKKLDDAQEKLKKAQDELTKIPNKTYKGIRKDDVTLADYEQKKGTIAAKKIYYDEELDKLLNDPDYKSWLSDVDKQQKIQDLYKLKSDLDEFEQKGKEYAKEYAKRQKAVKNAQDEVNSLTPVSDAYTQARKDAALWPKDGYNGALSRKEYLAADKYFDGPAAKVHATRTNDEYQGYYYYTGGSGPFNSPLAGFKNGFNQSGKGYLGPGKVDIDVGGYGSKIRGLTSLTERSTYDRDFWIQSGQYEATLDAFLNVPYDSLAKMTDSELQQFVGVQNEIPQFISGSINKGGGSYIPGDTMFNIYCPAGSEALYVRNDGYFRKNEHEMILQRGGKYKVDKIYWGTDIKGNKRLIVDLELHPEAGYNKFQQ